MVAIKIIKKKFGSCKPFDPSVSFLNKYLNVKFISICEEKKLIKTKLAQQKCENGLLINNDEQVIEDLRLSLFNNTKCGLVDV